MQRVNVNWDEIAAVLEPLRTASFNPGALRRFYQEGHGRPGLHFFKIRYSPGEVIMMKGTYSDFVGLHLSGDITVRLAGKASPTPGVKWRCWDRPGPLRRSLNNWI